jgi:subtilisin family serine protease
LKKNNLLKISFAAPILVSVLIASSPALASTSSSITVSTAQDAEVSAQVEAMGVDAGYEAQWGLQIIHANEVWSVSTGANVIVAVIDSGSGPNNDLQQNILPGRSIIRGRFSEGGNDVDSIGHGTHVAGIIAAQSDNDIGIAGVAPSAKILPIRVLDSNGDGSESDVALAIRFAIESGKPIVAMCTINARAVSPSDNYSVRPGIITVQYLGPYPTKHLKKENLEELKQQVFDDMYAVIKQENRMFRS